LQQSRSPRALHSFPTRRSSDLIPVVASATPVHATAADKPLLDVLTAIRHRTTLDQAAAHGLLLPNCEHRLQPETTLRTRLRAYRSEEHTSELQSPCNLVCRLLL